ncbi:dipeptidase [Muricoccus radiodurans]|uniref:dipeptidase n=1 Tax=Muricoccus radiodurans TaxID=2231721 RepID=UPI003CEA8E94
MTSPFWDTVTSCDLVLPYSEPYENLDSILPRYIATGISFVSLSLSGDRHGIEGTMRHLAMVRADLLQQPERLRLALSVTDIRRAKAEHRLAVGFNFQGSNGLGGELDMVDVYYALGVRQMLLAYNKRNAAADGCLEESDAGLSGFGRNLVRRMNAVGMIVDATHTGYRSCRDLFEVSSAPVIFSHSNAQAVHGHERNISDDLIRASAASGGVIGVTGIGNFLSEEGTAEVTDMMRHIRYMADLVGPQHVAIGIDNVYFTREHYRNFAKTPQRWTGRNALRPPPWNYFAPEEMPALADALLDGGFSEAEARGILGENYLRVAEGIWK